MSKTKLVCGIGRNDYNGTVSFRDENGKKQPHKFYSQWQGMMMRCYNPKWLEKYPTYIGCEVDPEWHSLSEFKEWVDGTYVDGYHLDKDLLITGNKIYSPQTCCWLPSELNQFLTNKNSKKGEFPVGVCFHKPSKKYLAQIRINNNQKNLGYFYTPEEAHQVYSVAKQQHLITLLQRYAGDLDGRVIQRLEQMIAMPLELFKDEFC